MTKDKRDKLFDDNIGLVYSIAAKFKANTEPLCYYEDVLQEGFTGLWLAANRYDESMGHSFTTYAYPLIWGQIVNYLNRFINQQKKLYYEKPILYSLNTKISTERSKYGDNIEYIDMIESNYDCENEKEYNDLVNDVLKAAYKQRFDIDDICNIIKLRLKGKNQKQISEIIGVSQMTVSRRLQIFKPILIKELQI